MKELEYPFDESYILLKKKHIKKQLLKNITEKSYIKKKIAILGGATTNDIKLVLELFLLNHGIYPEFYESEYNCYYEEAVFFNEELEKFQPDIIYVCTFNRNIMIYPEINDTVEEVDNKLEHEYKRFLEVWSNLEQRYHCPIIQNNFELPFYRLMGNKEASDIHGCVNFITRLNLKFYEYAQVHDNFYICDINYISADYGLKKWSDPFYWYMYKYALNVSAIPYLSFNIANIIKSIFGKNKKGFVLDLDNTLWGGVVGDDGVNNLQIGQENAEGQAYWEFQNYIKKHKQLGVILNINSKNELENALDGLNYKECVLKPEDFILIKSNWDPKDINYKKIAQELELLPESLVFIDDNPAERELVVSQISEVCAPVLEQVHQYIQVIDRSGFFEITSLSEDDKIRTQMYRNNMQRIELQNTYQDYTEYLLSLEMKAVIKEFELEYVQRITQLTNKSNQFNLTTRRYTSAEIETIMEDSNYITLYANLEDKFGSNGLVSVIIGHILDNVCHIDLWCMSCRVLKRNLEYAMLDELVERCKKYQLNKIIGYYYPTAKNGLVANFYDIQGFQKVERDSIGSTKWEFEIKSNYVKKNNVINING